MRYQCFSPKQALVMTWWAKPSLSRYDGVICDGAIRSGKTLCMTAGFLLWISARFDGERFAICGKTIESVRRNLILPAFGWVEGVLELTERRGEALLTVRGFGHENSVYLFGGKDEGSAALIQGMTLAGVLLDEAALMPRSFVEQACARCSVEGSRLWFNCNPEGPEHWFYKEWICRSEERRLLRLHFTMEDNPALPPKIRQRYERLYTGVFYRRFILGEWCRTEGLVYPFDIDKWVTEELPENGRWFISVDYGTLNPFSAGLWCLSDGIAYRVDEYYHDGRESGQQRTDEEYHEALERLAGGRPIERVVVDPSAASFLTLLRRKGIFPVRKAKNAVLPGICLTAGLLQQGRLRFHPQCRDLLREFRLYRWEDSTAADRPVKENDHAMDELRYFCATVLDRELR